MPSASVHQGSGRGWPGTAVWRVRLLGAVQADCGSHQLLRFSSRAAALLLARLALAPERSHPREALVELLWPGVALSVGRNRLRQTLSTLKTLLETADRGAVLQADRLCIHVAPGALACDVHEFEAAVRAGLHASLRELGGEFMPGFYEDWVQEERQRLAALLDRALAAADLPASGAAGAPLAPVPGERLHIHPSAARPAAAERRFAPALADTVADALADAVAAPAAVRLPRYLTNLFGAEPMLQQLAALLHTQRLVTVLGPGGAGKTRLAVEAAGRHASSGNGRLLAQVVFVPLVSCRSAADLLAALAAALHLPPATAADTAHMAQGLAALPSLLVLDNCEQLLDPAAAAIGALLAECPLLQVLVTSRRALALDGEQVTDLQPLPLPAQPLPGLAQETAVAEHASSGAPSVAPSDAPDDVPTAALNKPANPLSINPAVALFTDRARAARADFRLSQRQAGAVAALVRALGGLPLAIELAASRVRSFSPQEMLQALAGSEAASRLDLLERPGPRSGHDARHASMRRVVAWSWQLLAPAQQRLLAELSTFAAPFTAAAARAVHGSAAHLLLDNLVTHSLLRTEAGDTTRFALYEPVRDYARLQLEETHSAEDQHELRQRVRHWLLNWARTLSPGTPLAQIKNEVEQLRELLRGAAADGACGQVLQIVLALRLWWDSDGMPPADIEAIEAALLQWPPQPLNPVVSDAASATAAAAGAAATPDDQAQRADVHELLAYLRFGAGNSQAARLHAQQALQLAGSAAGPRARALLRQAWLALASYETGATLAHTLQEALQLAEVGDDRVTQARVLHQMAVLELVTTANLQRADGLLQAAQQLWLQLGCSALASARQRSRAELLHRQCRWAEAIAIYDECAARARASGDWVGLMDSALLRGLALAGQRRWADAAASLALCTQVAWQRHHAHGLAYALWHQARVRARLRQPEAAARLLGFAQVYWREHVGALNAEQEKQVHRVQALVAAQAGAAQAAAWTAQGATMAPAQAVAWAVA